MERLAKIREKLAQAGLDAVLITDEKTSAMPRDLRLPTVRCS